MERKADVTNLYKLLNELGINMAILAKETGISSGNIADWKSGRSVPTATKLVQIADYLGCSIDYLVGRTDTPNKVTADQNIVHRLLKADDEFIDLDMIVVPPVMNNKDYYITRSNFVLILMMYETAANDDMSIPTDDTEFKKLFTETTGGFSISPKKYIEVLKVYNIYKNYYFTQIIKKVR